ncbi:MFS transporter [Microbulbifer halophilus]|uniref:MFS transporter n=1 Tax=Microbulbifer halophilus TaxID=453963 RepID=A0ABW5EGE7_9GAMM|nr:MFS transporter [Microbulbifer halophilus]MCW8128577.1 MFS transporter [Microbulbifer halophilus]
MNTTSDPLTADHATTSVTRVPKPLAGAREWAGLAVLALPTILLGLDVTLMYLALPALASDLQPSSTQALWIMDAYGFMIAGFLITMGTLGDRVGRRRLLMIGAVAFGAASVLAAYSTSAAMLIAARAALGVAGATLMPSTLALISNMFADARQRALAIGVWATMFALGMAAGPVVGGVLLEHFWWGSAFLVAVPVVAILLVAAPVLLPEYRAPQSGQLDLFSVVLSLAATLPAIYGLKESAKDGLGTEPIAALVAGMVFAVWFVHRQRCLANPLLDMRLFTNRAFSAALLILLFGLVGVGGAMLLVTQYLQLVAGLSPLAAGLFMGPPALAMLVGGIASPLISRRIRPSFVVAGALALSATGYFLLAQLDSSGGITLLVAGFSLVYLGLGTIAALGTDLVVSAAPAPKAGSASAMSEMVQELGIAMGVAILGSLTTALYHYRIADQIPGHLPNELSRGVSDSLWAASEIANQLPDGLLVEARAAFTFGFSIANLASAAVAIILAILSTVALRYIGVIGIDAHDCSARDVD